MPRSVGKTARDIRKFCRTAGVKPSLANVERIQREVARTESENDTVDRVAKETGRGGLRDERGPIGDRAKDALRRRMARESEGR